MEPAKYPPKVKSENVFYNSRVLERNLHVPFLRVLGPFYSGEVLPPFLAEQASQTCRASFLKRDGQVWAFVPTGGPRERMGPTFFGRVDMGILGLPMGPLGLPDLISQFTLFSSKI